MTEEEMMYVADSVKKIVAGARKKEGAQVCAPASE
jgi:hypothetical protein